MLHDPTAKVHEAALSYDGQQHSLRSDRWAYMRYTDETEELYDMDADPGQLTNLAKNSEHGETLESFRQQLQVLLKSSGEPKRKKKAEKVSQCRQPS